MPEVANRTARLYSGRRTAPGPVALLGLLGLAVSGAVGALTPPAAKPVPRPQPALVNGAFNLEWGDLLPDQTRFSFQLNMAPTHGYLGEAGPPARQTGSSEGNPQIDGKQVRISGFVVPLAMNKKGIVTEFFLVPYFGACIHVPPPPPNQIVYVKIEKGFQFESIYQPQMVTGTMRVQSRAVQMASAAYTLAATKIEPYE